jgi:hypothetical protein
LKHGRHFLSGMRPGERLKRGAARESLLWIRASPKKRPDGQTVAAPNRIGKISRGLSCVASDRAFVSGDLVKSPLLPTGRFLAAPSFNTRAIANGNRDHRSVGLVAIDSIPDLPPPHDCSMRIMSFQSKQQASGHRWDAGSPESDERSDDFDRDVFGLAVHRLRPLSAQARTMLLSLRHVCSTPGCNAVSNNRPAIEEHGSIQG